MKYLLLETETNLDLYNGNGGSTEPKIIGQYDRLLEAYEKAIDTATEKRNKVESKYDSFDCIDDIDFLSSAAFESLLKPNKLVSACYFNGMYNNGQSNVEYHYYIAEIE